MSPPRVEVCSVRLDVLASLGQAVRMEHEPAGDEGGDTTGGLLVGGEEDGAEGALDALGPGRVVSGRHELPPAAPGALVHDLKGEAVRQARRGVVPQETLAQALGLATGDHAAPPGRRVREGEVRVWVREVWVWVRAVCVGEVMVWVWKVWVWVRAFLSEGGYLEEMGIAPALRRISSWTGVHWRGRYC